MSFPILKLKKNECRRLRAGHLWIFSNEVDTGTTPLNGFKPGETVTVTSSHGEKLGNAYINPHSLICARIFSHNIKQALDFDFLKQQIQLALQLRNTFFSEPYYRLIYGESDFLPGLIVDRFDNTLVLQTATLGMNQIQPTIIEALNSELEPQNIILKNDLGARKLEELDSRVEIVKGNPGETLQVLENNTQFQFSATGGQKTGWFYDHRLNRRSMQNWVKGKRVLDVFSYVGAWGIQAAVAGASEVHFIESSATACEFINLNATMNHVADRIDVIQQDAFDALSRLGEEKQKYDVIILDPPAFIKRRKDIKQGTGAYQRLHKLALQLLSKNGLIVSASCSFHFQRSDHLKVLRNTAYKTRHRLQVVEENRYAPDHPVHPAIPETDYLTCFTLRVTKE